MHVISLTYRYDKIKPSFELALFFRTMGIFVVEKYHDQKVNMQEDVDLLKSDFADVGLSDSGSNFDAEIYLVDNIAELRQIEYIDPSKRIVISRQQSTEGVEENVKFIRLDETVPNYFSQLLYDILQAMLDQNLLDQQEFEDCCKWAKIYGENGFFQILCQLGYSRLNETKLTLWKEQYYTIINEMFGNEIVFSEERNFWKQSHNKHIGFALLAIQYNINAYAGQQKQKKMFDSKELLLNAIALEENDFELNGRVKSLIGDIYYNLLKERNMAYDYFLSSCILNQDYNYNIFYAKGKYQQYVTGNYDDAKKYYYKSLLINPNYHRAWYSLGFCFYQQGETGKAISTFYALRKLLESRLESHNIKPLEIIIYFSACSICAQLMYSKFANLNKAIEFFQEAEKAWRLAGKSHFWELLGQEASDSAKYLQEQMDILYVYNSLTKLYDKRGAASVAGQYRAKRQEEIQRRRENEQKILC